MSNMGTSTSYRRGEGETTEWEDILAAKGIIPKDTSKEEKLKAEAEELERIEEALAAVDPLEGRTLDELDDLEADGAFADSHILDKYRAARIEQLKLMAAKNKFGRVYPLSRPDFVREVSEASKECWVVVLLYKDAVKGSPQMEEALGRLAPRHKAVKFMKIIADQCIENYPDRNVPTVFVYHDGAVASQFVGTGAFGGDRITVDNVEWVLAKAGALETELEADPRGPGGGGAGGSGAGAGRGRGYLSDDSDDD